VKTPAAVFEMNVNGTRRSNMRSGLKCRDGFLLSENSMISHCFEQQS